MPLLSQVTGRLLRLPAPASRELLVERDLRAAMDDGVVLLADRIAPLGTERAPTVLVRSPYGRRGAFGLLYGRLLAERGLQVLIQSVRGTFGSEGEFDPFDERADGLATVRWLREQPWHAGPIGAIGPSYMGLVQWAIADELDALAPSVTASQFRGMAHGSGALALDTALSWMLLLRTQERRLGPLLAAHGLRRTLPRVLASDAPIGELDERAFGAAVPYFRRWMEELEPDSDYWSVRDFSASVADVTAPVQLVGGWHDIFLPWLLEDFRALRAAGRPVQLVVGPWTHTAPGMTGTSLREGIGWLRAQLLGDRRLVRDTPVRVYVSGDERGWVDLAEWPPPNAREHVLHLRPGGELGAGPVEDDGPGAPTRFVFDPADPTPALGGATLLERAPVRDNAALEARADVVAFTGPPLEAPLTAIGPVRVELHVRTDPGHADVFARLCDVDAEGVSRNVCDALVRLTPEDPPRDAGGVAAVGIDLWPTAHRFAAGHRLRLLVAGGAHPRYARNPGTGEDPARATALVAQAHEVLHDARHPSQVVLSVV